MIAAGGQAVRSGAAVGLVSLDIALFAPAVADAVPHGDALWRAAIRQPERPRWSWWLAWWRRARRRRAGLVARHLCLRWTPRRLEAFVDGERVAQIIFTPSGDMR